MSVTRPLRVAAGSIASVDNLCAALAIERVELDSALALDESQKYLADSVPKADGTLRTVYNPHRLIRRIQRRINKRILSPAGMIAWPEFIYGSLPNQRDGEQLISKDYVACAGRHCGAKSVLKMDIKDFFDNISRESVKQTFLAVLKYPEEVSATLAEICCYKGHLVQGALTSSYLACLSLHDVESGVVSRLNGKGLVYTRFVDDITVSSKIEGYSFDYAANIIRGMLESKDLPVNSSKTRIQRLSTESILVHGLRVSFNEPRLPSDEVRRIRAAVKNVELLAKEANYRTTHSYRHDFNRCMGRVNKLARVGHLQHKKLIRRLKSVQPLPSRRDIERVGVMIERLKKDHPAKVDTYWYSRRFYLAHERLNLIKRTFPSAAAVMRASLKGLMPTYD